MHVTIAGDEVTPLETLGADEALVPESKLLSRKVAAKRRWVFTEDDAPRRQRARERASFDWMVRLLLSAPFCWENQMTFTILRRAMPAARRLKNACRCNSWCWRAPSSVQKVRHDPRSRRSCAFGTPRFFSITRITLPPIDGRDGPRSQR